MLGGGGLAGGLGRAGDFFLSHDLGGRFGG